VVPVLEDLAVQRRLEVDETKSPSCAARSTPVSMLNRSRMTSPTCWSIPRR
jgi:hypothetical protein